MGHLRAHKTLSILLLMLLIVMYRFLLVQKVVDNASLYDYSAHNKSKTCQRTKIFPFKIGCPARCEWAVSEDEPMYRMGVTWWFGEPEKYPLDHPTAYSKGINFQCSNEFTEAFGSSSDLLHNSLVQSLPNTTGTLIIKRQKVMHLALSYLCCLRKNETDRVREIAYKWVQDVSPFEFEVAFDRVECYHERQNSVTTIIVADARSQRTIASMNQELNERLQRAGIPVSVKRRDQMPSHVTLQGVQYGNDYNMLENDISSYLPLIYDKVSDLSQTMGSSWTGKSPFLRSVPRMVIKHAPYFSFKGSLHAGKEKK
ncbi:expressed unknown protein [Seminavis robusta]|uniref:Uncharacterized protein n=1 Tax=Seminavis robusta TaxID=568900 RepID=A0A9N8DSL5_9STRA|nr:expressed unknown protein [Seminavis robusta]|eukprot:Sro249_g098770.1 n/a (313) ;mRNA; f:57221-58159